MTAQVKDQSAPAQLMLLLFFQSLFALCLFLAGRFTILQDSSGWPVGMFLANLIGVVLLIKKEGARYRDIF